MVGYLTSGMIDETAEKSTASPEKAHALAYNIFALSALFWALCCCFWLIMACVVDSSSGKAHVRKEKSDLGYAKVKQKEKEEGY